MIHGLDVCGGLHLGCHLALSGLLKSLEGIAEVWLWWGRDVWKDAVGGPRAAWGV